MVRLVYDYQIFSRQKYGGISRYIYELAKCIKNEPEFDVRILAGFYINQYLRSEPSDLVKGFAVPKINKTGKLIDQLNATLSKVWLSSNPVEIVHETFYSPQRLASRHTRIVLTVYDMIDEKFYGDSDFAQHKATAIERADHIVCISENTKNDLLKFLAVDANKISVIYLGYSLEQFPEDDLDEFPIDAPYLLYVGDRYGYKNFSGLLQAYASSERLKKDFKLVCFGGLSLAPENLQTAYDLGIPKGNLLHFSGDDRLLQQFYKRASVFVYPSLYEGFGIPPLEAMALSCPVVCSNTSSIPEVVGDAAELFNPVDCDHIAAAIETVVYSAERTEQLKALGKTRSKLFSWEKCAYETRQVYQALV